MFNIFFMEKSFKEKIKQKIKEFKNRLEYVDWQNIILIVATIYVIYIIIREVSRNKYNKVILEQDNMINENYKGLPSDIDNDVEAIIEPTADEVIPEPTIDETVSKMGVEPSEFDHVGIDDSSLSKSPIDIFTENNNDMSPNEIEKILNK